jgi:hypothetical protein
MVTFSRLSFLDPTAHESRYDPRINRSPLLVSEESYMKSFGIHTSTVRTGG